MGLELKGVNEVVKSFENIQKMVERNITKSYKKSGEELLKKSNELAPKGTGNMVKNSDKAILQYVIGIFISKCKTKANTIHLRRKLLIKNPLSLWIFFF